MKAIGLYKYLAIENEESLIDLELDQPTPTGQDLLIAVKAISVNPVDTKIRAPKDTIESVPKILGWDGAGEVVAVGEDVKHFAVGDQVYYAGDITRAGSNSEYQLVDERIVGRMPETLDYTEAAALPLTSITAWEALFDRLDISKTGEDKGKSILIIGGAGGVGSIAIQLAKQLAQLTVIGTASRPETVDWVKARGADIVINHRKPIDQELDGAGVTNVDYILCLNSTGAHWSAMANAIAPQGRICSIVDTEHPVDINLLKSKSVIFSWEFMYTRSMFQTADMIEQQRLLNEVAELIDHGQLSTTVNKVVRPINAANLRSVHALIEQGSAIGKIVLADWK